MFFKSGFSEKTPLPKNFRRIIETSIKAFSSSLLHQNELLFFGRRDKLRRLLAVIDLSCNPLHLRLDVVEQLPYLYCPVSICIALALHPFQHKIREKPMSFFLIGRAYLVA